MTTLTKEQEALLVILNGLHDDPDKWVANPMFGICHQLQEHMEGYPKLDPVDCYSFVEFMSATWSERRCNYPSPLPIAPSSSNSSCPLWEGTQLIQRKSLIKHLINNINKYSHEALELLEQKYYNERWLYHRS